MKSQDASILERNGTCVLSGLLSAHSSTSDPSFVANETISAEYLDSFLPTDIDHY